MPQLKDLAHALETFAPNIAGFFGGPMAAMGVAEVERVFGLTPPAGASISDRQQASLAALAVATPEQVIALKKADSELAQKFVDGGIRLRELDAQGVAGAQLMESKTGSQVPGLLTLAAILGFIAMAFFVLGDQVPGMKNPATAGVAGALVLEVIHTLRAAVKLWLGSSGDDTESDALLNKGMKIGAKD